MLAETLGVSDVIWLAIISIISAVITERFNRRRAMDLREDARLLREEQRALAKEQAKNVAEVKTDLRANTAKVSEKVGEIASGVAQGVELSRKIEVLVNNQTSVMKSDAARDKELIATLLIGQPGHEEAVREAAVARQASQSHEIQQKKLDDAEARKEEAKP